MKFKWEFDKGIDKKFSQLDNTIQRRIIKWLNTNIQDCVNPRIFGEPLEGDKRGLWRYRVGKYRIIADIHDDVFTVLVVKVGKRGQVYKH